MTYYIAKISKTKKEYIMSDEIYDNMKKKYSWDRQLEKLFLLYDNVLKEGKRGSGIIHYLKMVKYSMGIKKK